MERTSSEWRAIFEQWPVDIERQGLILTVFEETVPFVDFRVSEGALLLQRDRPDSMGARKIIIAWDGISALKFTDPADLAIYERMGFRSVD